MIIIMAFILSVFFLVFAACYDENWLIAICLTLVLGTIAGVCLWNSAACDIIQTTETPLYSGYSDNRISGSFTLGSGRIDDVDYAFFWVNDHGIKSKHSRKMSESVFIEDGKNVLIDRDKVCPEKYDWFFVSPHNHLSEFHVPEGSINNMYLFN